MIDKKRMKIEEILNKHLEGNYLIGKTAKEEIAKDILALFSVSDSYLPKCTRVEVIDKSGRAYTNYNCKSVETQMQDEDRTLKVFIQ
jgi:hypothetical protein